MLPEPTTANGETGNLGFETPHAAFNVQPFARACTSRNVEQTERRTRSATGNRLRRAPATASSRLHSSCQSA